MRENTYSLSSFRSWAQYKIENPDIKEAVDFVYDRSKSPIDMLQLLVSEGLSYHQVAQELNFRGYRTEKHRRYTPASVKSIAAKTLDTQVTR